MCATGRNAARACPLHAGRLGCAALPRRRRVQQYDCRRPVVITGPSIAWQFLLPVA